MSAKQSGERRGEFNQFTTLSLVILCSMIANATSFTYLGCYGDNDVSRDMTGPVVSLLDPNVTVDSCLANCQTEGYAYGALQKGENNCYCGASYGYYGPATTGCTMTCGDDMACGGVLINSVYYTVDSSPATLAQQTMLFEKTFQPFDTARMDCVGHGGDLVAFNQSGINETINIVTQVSTSVTKIWIGMRQNTSTTQYQWINPAIPAFDSSLPDALEWKPEQIQSPCVLFDITTGLIETAPCNVPFSYVCRSIPWPAESVYTPATPVTGDSSVALYIILPIFMICYGGSCLIYCIHKIVQTCTVKPQKKMIFDDSCDKAPILDSPSRQSSVRLTQRPGTGKHSSIVHPISLSQSFDKKQATFGGYQKEKLDSPRVPTEELPPPPFFDHATKDSGEIELKGIARHVTDHAPSGVTRSHVNLLRQELEESCA